MRYWLIIALLLFPQMSFAEIIYFDIVAIDGINLVSRSEKFSLGEDGTVRDQNEKPVNLREIKLPARAKADYVIEGEQKILNWVILIDRKNNQETPE